MDAGRTNDVNEAIEAIRMMRGVISFEGLDSDDLKQMMEEGQRLGCETVSVRKTYRSHVRRTGVERA